MAFLQQEAMFWQVEAFSRQWRKTLGTDLPSLLM